LEVRENEVELVETALVRVFLLEDAHRFHAIVASDRLKAEHATDTLHGDAVEGLVINDQHVGATQTCAFFRVFLIGPALQAKRHVEVKVFPQSASWG
jgi:hypothetical protein